VGEGRMIKLRSKGARIMIRLLIIDDDIATCNFLKAFFCQTGYEVFTANDGDQAVVLVRDEKPDVILLDVLMPGLSGIEVLQKIKKASNGAKIIMMSAVDAEVVVELAMKYGADGYIVKPFSLEALEKAISRKASKTNP